MSKHYADYETGLSLFDNDHEQHGSSPEIIRPHGESGHVEASKNPNVPSEDASFVDDEHMAYGVFDGVGGSDAGAAASRIARDTFHDRLTTPRARDILDDPNVPEEQAINLLIDTTNLTNANIASYVSEKSLEAGKQILCQTTATVVVVKQTPDGPKLIGINIGDSRALIDPQPEDHPDRDRQQRDIAERTEEGMLKKPDIYNELATDDSKGNVLNDALDGKNRSRSPQIITTPLRNNSRLLLMSDGVSGDWANGDVTHVDKKTGTIDYFTDTTQFKTQAELNKYFDRSRSPKQVAQEMADDSRKYDDITAIVVDFGADQPSGYERHSPKLNKKDEKIRQKRRKELDAQLTTAAHAYASAIVEGDEQAINDAEDSYYETNAYRLELSSEGLGDEAFEQHAQTYTENEQEQLHKLIGAYRYVHNDQAGRYKVNEQGDIVEKRSAAVKRWFGKIGIEFINENQDASNEDEAKPEASEPANEKMELLPQPNMTAAFLPIAAIKGELGPEHAYEFTQDPATGEVSRKPGAAGRVWQATKNKYYAAYGAMLGGGSQKSQETTEASSDEDKNNKYKYAAWGAAIGVVAIVAANKLGVDVNPSDWFGSDGKGNARPNTTPPAELPSDPLPTTPEEDKKGNGNGNGDGNDGNEDRGDDAGGRNQEPTVNKRATLTSGETIWAEAQQALGPDASIEDIDRVKDAILQNEGLSEHDATHLPVGYRFRLPLELIEELTKEAEKAKKK